MKVTTVTSRGTIQYTLSPYIYRTDYELIADYIVGKGVKV